MGQLLSSILYESAPLGSEEGRRLGWWCPGCKGAHFVHVEKPNQKNALWRYSGDAYAPSFHPSVWIKVGPWSDGFKTHEARSICHCWVKNGQIEFLSDCAHDLAGQTVPMVPWPAGRRFRGDDE